MIDLGEQEKGSAVENWGWYAQMRLAKHDVVEWMVEEGFRASRPNSLLMVALEPCPHHHRA